MCWIRGWVRWRGGGRRGLIWEGDGGGGGVGGGGAVGFGGAGGGGGDLGGWGWSGAGVLGAGGSDRGAVRGLPVWGCWWTDVPDGGCGAVGPLWGAGVHRPGG